MCPAETVFTDADHVLIPKFSIYSPWVETAMDACGDYPGARFEIILPSQ